MSKFTKTVLLVTAAALLPLAATAVQAEDYPWCAILGGGDSIKDCGFNTVEQCREHVRGLGGSCERNMLYPAPKQVTPPRRKSDR